LVIFLDPLHDLLQVTNLHPKARLLYAVVENHPLVAFAAQRLDFFKNFFGGNYLASTLDPDEQAIFPQTQSCDHPE